MVLDTSALIALLLGEPEAPTFRAAIEADVVRLVSAANLLETAMVIQTRLGEQGGRELDLLIRVAECEVVPVDSAQVAVARQAFRRFGKGRHSAGLNFGDCFAYALALTTAEPLLVKGSDFAATDVLRVV